MSDFSEQNYSCKMLKIAVCYTQSDLSQVLKMQINLYLLPQCCVPLSYTIAQCLGKNSQNIFSLFFPPENHYAKSSLVFHKLPECRCHYAQLPLLCLQKEDLYILSHYNWSSLIFLALVGYSQPLKLLLQKWQIIYRCSSSLQLGGHPKKHLNVKE